MHEDADLRSSTREWRKLRSHAIVACCLNSRSQLRPIYLQVEYEKCAERIEAKGQGNCAGQYMDYIACADQCAKDAIFKVLK